MLKMIKYNLKKRSLFILISTIISFAIAFATYSSDNFLERVYYAQGLYVDGPSTSPLAFVSTIACILCTIIPILEFSFKMKKINIDQMYSLPIKREKLYLAKYISGLIEILIPVTIVFIYCVLKVISTNHMYDMIYFLPYFGWLLVLIFVLYSTITFFYTRANTIVDGILNIAFIVFLFVIVTASIDEVFLRNIRYRYLTEANYFIYSPINMLTNYFDYKLQQKAILELQQLYEFEYSYGQPITINQPRNFLPIVLFLVIGLGAFVLFIILNKKEKAENSMQVSNSWFSYRVMIPIYFTSISLMFMESGELISFIFLFVGVYIAYIIYRRTLKIKKWDMIVIGICFVMAIIVYSVYSSLKPTNPNEIYYAFELLLKQ